jgi:hypothetical protein
MPPPEIPKGRVQVRDLSEAERIQPSQPGPSTYEGAPAKPVDTNMEALTQALGGFNTALLGYHRANQHIKDNEAKRERIGQYYQYYAALNPADRLTHLPGSEFWNDPFTRQLIRTHHALAGIENVGAEADRDPNYRAGFGTQGFNVDTYFRERARPFINSLRGNPEGSKAAVEALQSLIGRQSHRHDEERRRNANVEASEATGEMLNRHLIAAVNSPDSIDHDTTAASVWDAARDFVHRRQGGSLDRSHREIEDIMVNVLERHATDPRMAPVLRAIVRHQRLDENGRPQSLATSTRMGDKIRAVETTILQTARRYEIDAFRQGTRAHNLQAAERGVVGPDGSTLPFNIGMVQDSRYTSRVSIPGHAEHTEHYDRTKQLEDLRNDLLESSRRRIETQLPGGPNRTQRAAAETERIRTTFINLGLRLPESDELQGAFRLLTSTSNNPNAQEAFDRGLTQYERIAAQNPEYLRDPALGVSNHASRYFEAAQVLIGLGRGRQQIRAGLQRWFSMPEADQSAHLEASGGTRRINDAVAGIDFRRIATFDQGNYDRDNYWQSWMPGWGNWGGQPQNTQYLRSRVTEIARVLLGTGEANSPEHAVSEAQRYIQDRAVYVNGHVVVGSPGLRRGVDESVINRLLTDRWNNDPAFQAHARRWGASRPEHITLMPSGTGQWNLATIHGNSVVPLEGRDGNLVTITMNQIAQARTPTESSRADEIANTIPGPRPMGVNRDPGTALRRYYRDQARKEIEELIRKRQESQQGN